MEYVGVSVRERSQQRGVKPKMRVRKLRSGAYWQGEIKHKGVKQVGVKQGLRILRDEVNTLWNCKKTSVLFTVQYGLNP
jgi:hypothetical protein